MQLAIYKERLYPSVSFSIALALSGPMVLLAALPFGAPLAITLGILVPLSLNVIVRLLAPQINVSDGQLVADRISIPVEALGRASALNKEEFSKALGPYADPRAQLMIRGYVSGGVKIEVADPDDPTPYLLISSRNPEQLAIALDANRS
ncbi:MAG: DUF3093 domain-containing protein [Aquiluna sp.]